MRALITHLLVRKQAAMPAASLIPSLSVLWAVLMYLIMLAGTKHRIAQHGQVPGGVGYGQKHIQVRDFDA